MKNSVFFTLLILISSISFSQDTPLKNTGFVGTFGVGTAIPVGTLNIGWKAGIHVNLNAGYIFSKNFAGRLDGAYSLLALDGGYPFSGGKFNIISLRGDLLIGNFRKNREFMPYVIAGAGVNFKRKFDLYYEDELDTPASSNTELGVVLGGGAAFRFSKKYSMFGELKYSHGFGKEPVSSFIPVTFGIMMTP